MTKLESRVGIVSHDAGGAEIISSYVLQQGLDPFYCLAGPAEHIFERKLGPLHLRPMDEVVDLAGWLLCGTGWQSELEWQALGKAKNINKRAVAYIDHWVNYQERFIRNGVVQMPDEIWVGDSYAMDIARRLFPATCLELVPNAYFDQMYSEFTSLVNHDSFNSTQLEILFISDNIGESMLKQHGCEVHRGFTDEDSLDYFLKNMNFFSGQKKRIVIRPHPSESREKYKALLMDGDRLKIELGGIRGLLDEISCSDIVIGSESMAMVIALLCGKRVVSCIPPSGLASRLPHEGIEKLSDLTLEL